MQLQIHVLLYQSTMISQQLYNSYKDYLPKFSTLILPVYLVVLFITTSVLDIAYSEVARPQRP